MTSDLSRQLDFLKEIDGLKSIDRASPIIDQSRCENSAEHSWHLSMYALVLAKHAEKDVNIDRVIRMLLIHDIVEIDAGDAPIHGKTKPDEQSELEQQAAERLYGLLPGAQKQELMSLWKEFEAAETPDAKFAKSLDRLQPLIQNVATDGGTWKQFSISEEQVYQRYGPQIARGSEGLWRKAKDLVSEFFRAPRSS